MDDFSLLKDELVQALDQLAEGISRIEGLPGASGDTLTRWAKDVSPENVLPEYPRPMLVRKDWMNLNGLWEYLIEPKNPFNDLANRGHDVKWDGKILVPYCVESALSGVKQPLEPENQLWYRRTFTVPARVLVTISSTEPVSTATASTGIGEGRKTTNLRTATRTAKPIKIQSQRGIFFIGPC